MNADSTRPERERRLRRALEATAATQDPAGDWDDAVARAGGINSSRAAPDPGASWFHLSRRALTVAVATVAVLAGAVGVVASRPGARADALPKVFRPAGTPADQFQECLIDAGVTVDIIRDRDDYGNDRVTITARERTEATRAAFERCSRPQPRPTELPASVEVELYAHATEAIVECLAEAGGFDVTTRGEPADGPVSYNVPPSQKGEAFNESMGTCAAAASAAEATRREELLHKQREELLHKQGG